MHQTMAQGMTSESLYFKKDAKVSIANASGSEMNKKGMVCDDLSNFEDTDEFGFDHHDAEPIKGPISYASKGQNQPFGTQDEDPVFTSMMIGPQSA